MHRKCHQAHLKYLLKIERQDLCRLSVLSSTSAGNTHSCLTIRPCGLRKKNGKSSPDVKESAINPIDALPWPFTHSILCWFHLASVIPSRESPKVYLQWWSMDSWVICPAVVGFFYIVRLLVLSFTTRPRTLRHRLKFNRQCAFRVANNKITIIIWLRITT